MIMTSAKELKELRRELFLQLFDFIIFPWGKTRVGGSSSRATICPAYPFCKDPTPNCKQALEGGRSCHLRRMLIFLHIVGRGLKGARIPLLRNEG